MASLFVIACLIVHIVLKLGIGLPMGQTAHADAVADLQLPGLRRIAEPVRSTRLQTFLTASAQLPPFPLS